MILNFLGDDLLRIRRQTYEKDDPSSKTSNFLPPQYVIFQRWISIDKSSINESSAKPYSEVFNGRESGLLKLTNNSIINHIKKK